MLFRSPPGHVIVNPPYGERLAGGQALYREMARAFRRLRGHRVGILSGTPGIEYAMAQRLPEPPVPEPRSLSVWNGAIECRLLTYDIP